ncbi:putative T7SS-secreted protein [Streptomyces sp. NPDC001941]|uniref:WXG100 family type VII secretion target n=1 Tax=Streptomyces sp. NPDC001941 TaxID=3154659 RepID=UPI00332DAFBE
MGVGDWLSGGKDLLDKGLDKVEDGIDAGKKALGEGIDWTTDRIGDGLEYVGADDWADKVEDWGDDTASSLGASVKEQQLGQTEEPDELVHGKPERIREVAGHLKDFGAAFDKVGGGMRSLDSAHWKGASADAFREKFAMHPPQWLHAADACEDAGKALTSYAETVTWAQGRAKEAVALYKKGKKASEDAVGAYNKKVDAYNAALKSDRDPGPKPEPFSDPGKADRDHAQEVLKEARRQRDDAARTAQQAVEKAMAHAPKEPPASNRLASTALDGYGALQVETAHVVGGVVKGTAGIVNFARGLNPMDPYNLTHPAQYMQNVNMTLAGLVSTAAHPERIPGALIDSFKKDPSEGLGRLLPELIGTKGMGTVRTGVRLATKEGAEAAVEGAARRGAHDLPGQRVPDMPSHPPTVHDKLHAAADRSVDVSKIPDHAQWRTTDEPLWRNDNRPPDEIFRDGFKPWNNHNTDLDGYVRHNEQSVYVGTTRDPDLGWSTRYRYDVDAPGGIDVNKSIPDNIFANEKEIAFPGGVRTENIKGVTEQLPDGTTRYIPNPHYSPHAAPPGAAAPPSPPTSLLPPGWTQ